VDNGIVVKIFPLLSPDPCERVAPR
jgi:hypothetical protein